MCGCVALHAYYVRWAVGGCIDEIYNSLQARMNIGLQHQYMYSPDKPPLHIHSNSNLLHVHNQTKQGFGLFLKHEGPSLLSRYVAKVEFSGSPTTAAEPYTKTNIAKIANTSLNQLQPYPERH